MGTIISEAVQPAAGITPENEILPERLDAVGLVALDLDRLSHRVPLAENAAAQPFLDLLLIVAAHGALRAISKLRIPPPARGRSITFASRSEAKVVGWGSRDAQGRRNRPPTRLASLATLPLRGRDWSLLADPSIRALCEVLLICDSSRALRALDLGKWMLGRVCRRHRLAVADDHAHERFLDPLVDEAAIDTGRHGKQIALFQDGLETLPAMLDDEAQLVAAQDEEYLLGVGMKMQRALASGRQHHGREGEMLGRNDVVVGDDSGAAGADIAHLGAAVFLVVVGLELERVPVERPGLVARDARIEPRGQALAWRNCDAFRPDLGI